MKQPGGKLFAFIDFFLSHRLFRYGVAGAATFAVNMAVVWICIEEAGWSNTETQRNVSHFVGAEASILFSFHAHNFWTWGTGREGYFRRIVQFHLLTAVTIILRQVGFYFLDRAGQSWIISTLIPLMAAILINFLGYDRMVFRRMRE